MLPHYSPLKVAESFSMLSALCPDRIDLAVGRAPGSDTTTMFALQRDRRYLLPDDFTDQLSELSGYLQRSLPADHPFARLSALPGGSARPDLWLLGSSPQSGLWAAERGLPYAFADFINPAGRDIATHYRRTFQPSSWRTSPEVIVAVWVVCAETNERARELAASAAMSFKLLQRGVLIPVPPVEKAQQFLDDERAREGEGGSGLRSRRRIVGDPETVRRGLEDVVRDYEADELMIVTITFDHAARRRSYELVAGAFGLNA
jgi:luciferase family oxidoreductase group 1